MEPSTSSLTVDSVSASYGMVRALWNASVSVAAGEIVSIIGANGAGKSTLLKVIMGLMKSGSGIVTFNGRRITGMKPHDIVSRGIAYVPEGRRLFPEMTVEENLRMGTSRRCPELAERFESVYELFPILEGKRRQLAGTLSGGEQQLVAVGRALMARPSLLLLDEPSFGLSPSAFQDVLSAVTQANLRGMGVLLAEQNAELGLKTSHRSYIFESGRVALSGKSSDLVSDPTVRSAYLGFEG